MSGQTAPQTPPAAPTNVPRVLVGVVTDGKTTISLQVITALIRLQEYLHTASAEPCFVVEVAFVKDANEALNMLHRGAGLAGAFIIDRDASVDPDFMVRAFRSGKSCVVCTMPLPHMDWNRVEEKILDPTEEVHLVGAVYNLDVDPVTIAEEPESIAGYARVKTIRAADAFFVRRGVLDAIAIKHPAILAEPLSAFYVDGAIDGTFLRGLDRFLGMWGGEIWTDLQFQGATSGPLEFAGCVGERGSQLR